MKKTIFVAVGFVFFALGAVGAALPVLPTTPFLLIAAACFARGSERFNRWFLGTKLYQRHLDSFVRERAMTLRTKVVICAFATTMLLIAFFMMNNIWGRIVVVGVIAVKYYYFVFRIRTIQEEA